MTGVMAQGDTPITGSWRPSATALGVGYAVTPVTATVRQHLAEWV